MRTFFTGLICFFNTALLLAQHEVTTYLPDVVSTDQIEYYTTFTPDGLHLYFVRRDATWGDFNDRTPGYIYESHFIDGQWSTPQIADFSGTYSDSAPFISTDGRWFFFTSNRPYDGKQGTGPGIWFMESTNAEWSKPQPMRGGINSAGTEYSPVLANSGQLYFASTRKGGLGQGDIYRCQFSEGICKDIQNLGKAINAPSGEWNVFVDPDETYMIFEASGRIQGRDYGDLYISFRKEGIWQKAQFLKEMNSEGSDLAVSLSRDGKWLFFAQSHDGEVDIKRVSVRVIEAYR